MIYFYYFKYKSYSYIYYGTLLVINKAIYIFFNRVANKSIQLTGITPSYISAFPMPGHGFPTSYVLGVFMFSELR